MVAFKREQRRLAASEKATGLLDFGDLGQLEVASVELVGWPEAAVLRADFMWINSGSRTRRAPTVRLSIIDEAGDDWRSQFIKLGSTYNVEFGNGSTHSTWLRVPTDGLHLRPGWTWGLELLDSEQAATPAGD